MFSYLVGAEINLPLEYRQIINELKKFERKINELCAKEKEIKDRYILKCLKRLQQDFIVDLNEHDRRMKLFIEENYQKICVERST